MSGRARVEFEESLLSASSALSQRARSSLTKILVWGFEGDSLGIRRGLVLKRGHIADLERRHQALKDEIAKALTHTSSDDLMIFDLNQRLLHLRDELALELERLRHQAITRKIYCYT